MADAITAPNKPIMAETASHSIEPDAVSVSTMSRFTTHVTRPMIPYKNH